jgi:hypothetical protein
LPRYPYHCKPKLQELIIVTVTFTGILTKYKGEAQFTLIDLNGVKKADGTNWY